MMYSTEKLQCHGAEIQQWLKDGQPELQFRQSGSLDNWKPVFGAPLWGLKVAYRYKPQPKPVWINTFINNHGIEFHGKPHTSIADAVEASKGCPSNMLISTAIKYEVIQ